MNVQVQWVDSNIGRMDFRVVVRRIDEKIFGLRLEVSWTLGSVGIRGKDGDRSLGDEMGCVVWADVQQRALISRNFFGVRRF